MKTKLWQITRFLIGGSITVLVYYGVLYSLTEFLHVWYLLSSVLAFVVYVGMNFLIQKYWTFKNNDRIGVQLQLQNYVLMMISLFIINTGALYSLVEYLHLNYLLAQLLLTVTLSIVSFRITKRIFAIK